MYTAFPCSDYYGSSAPLRRRRPATGLPRHDGRGRRSGSHVHPRTLQRGRWPAMPLQPRHGYAAVFHRGLPAGDITRPRSSTTGRPDRMCVATQPRSDRFELVVFGPTPSDSAGACRRCQGCFRRFFDSASARLAGSCPNRTNRPCSPLTSSSRSKRSPASCRARVDCHCHATPTLKSPPKLSAAHRREITAINGLAGGAAGPAGPVVRSVERGCPPAALGLPARPVL